MASTKTRGPSTLLFALLSVVYLAWIGYGAFFHWPMPVTLKLEAWGDLLAGVFSPLAFLWLLYAALAQRSELELQREELSANNETQRQQHSELTRQADALSKQFSHLQSQSDALYEPVFILVGGGAGQLHMRNLGAGIRDVTADYGRFVVVEALNENINVRCELVPYWPGNANSRLDYRDRSTTNDDFKFIVTYTRLDSVRGSHAYQFRNAEQRLQLLANKRLD